MNAQHDSYRFGDGSNEPVYLTNGCCESTDHVDAALFERLGLEAGSDHGAFYPLTDRELKYIGEDYADVASGFGAHLGYSALYQGGKYLMPSIELYFGEGGNVTSEAALAYGKVFVDDVKGRISGIGGHVFLEEEHDEDRHLIQVLVPVEYVMSKTEDFDAWKAHLEDVLLKSDLAVEVTDSPAP